MKFITPAAILAVALAATGAASATTLGLPFTTQPFSSTYDTFSATSFTNAAPTTAASWINSSLTFTSGGIVTGGGDRLYTNGAATTIDISGSTNIQVSDLQVLVKFTSPSVGTPADFFTFSLGGATATAQFVGTSTEGSNAFSIYQWTWTGVNLAAGANFQIVGGSSADHVSIDAIQVNAIPEASTALVGALAAGGLFIRRRRN